MFSAKTFRIISLTATIIALCPVGWAESTGALRSFHEKARLNLGGDGGWDYLTVDSVNRKLYIARSNRVMVIDVDSGKSVGEIFGLDGAHGIALVNERGLGFATSGKSGEVVIFDLKNLKTLDTVKTGENPDAIVYDLASKKIFAFNGKSKSASAIDLDTRKVVGTIHLPGKPEFAVSNGRGQIFVNIEDKNEILKIDSKHLKIAANYPLKPCEEPTGLSMDQGSHRLIVGCGNKLAAIVDAESGVLLQTFTVGEGVDATAFDSDRGLALISAGQGLLSILAEDKTGFKLIQDIPTIKGARTLAVDGKTGRIFLPFAQFAPSDPAKGGPHVRPSVIPGTFAVLVIEKD